MNMKPPEDFLNKINVRKDTAESNFSINANLDFVDETWQEPSLSNQEYAIKNYPINPHFNPNFRKDLRASSPQPQRRSMLQNGNYFRENLTLDELEKLEKKNVGGGVGYYPPNVEPPGLTPTSYMQKNTYQTFSDSIPKPINSLDNISPNIKGRDRPMNQMVYPPNSQDVSSFNVAYQSPPTMQQQQQYPNPYMNRMEQQMQMGANPFNRGQPQMMHFGQPQNPGHFMQNPNPKGKPVPLDDNGRRYTGHLKFFDETKNYGFIVMDEDGSDIFVHFDDLMKANLTKDMLRTAKNGNIIHLTFACMQYVGKYNRSRKAVDIQLLM